ncbi:MAG: beta-galactosidase, partial [Armatimonadetes bacterium]|nr:beta-galactosidase [Armatimonadota bacterium]
NLLAEQIEACHALDIRVPIYITVGWDEYAYHNFPGCTELSPEGRMSVGPLQAGWHKMCLNLRSPYMRYVEEQTREVLETFDVDGFFFDIILQGQCVCPYCMEGMREAGLDPAVESDRVTHSKLVLDAYKRRFADVVQEYTADATVFHNSGHIYPDWRPVLDTYTHLELESLPSGFWGYAHFPITMRYARRLGLDCMGMTGKFHTWWGDFSSFKHPEALEYEVFTQIANGAKCSIGDQLHPTGEICPETYRLVGGVYGRVEALEPWLRGAEPLAEIAVLNPEAVGKQDAQVDSAATGAYHMLAESHQQFDFVDCESDLARYTVLVLPDKITLEGAFLEKVRQFVAEGGAVVASYRSGLDAEGREFALPELSVSCLGDAEFSPDFVLALAPINQGTPTVPHVMYERGLTVAPAEGARILAETYDPYFNRTYEHFCSHQHTPPAARATRPAVVAGSHSIYLAHPVFGMYHRRGARFWKQLVVNSLAQLLPEPLVRTSAPTTAQITVTRQAAESRTMIHVLHYIPERRARDLDTIQDRIPLHDVRIALRREAAPSKAYLAPEGTPLECAWSEGYAEVTVPVVDGYAVIAFED